MALQKIKQIIGNQSGSVLFLGNNSVVTEDFNKLNWNYTDDIFSVNGTISINGAHINKTENIDVDPGTLKIISEVDNTFDAVFFDYVVKKGLNIRCGVIYCVHNGTSIKYNETSTEDIGNTDDVTLSVDLNNNKIRLLADVLSNDWSIKTLYRSI